MKRESDYMLYSARKPEGWNAQIGYAAGEKEPYVIIMNGLIMHSYKTMNGASRSLKALAELFGAAESSYWYITAELLRESKVELSAPDMRGGTARETIVKVF